MKLESNRVLKGQLRLVVLLYVPLLATMLLLVAIRVRVGIPLATFMEDPAYLSNTPFYNGIFSNIGIVLWCATATVCVFVSAVLFIGRNRERWFFLCSGLLMFALQFDDQFLLHETVFPDFLHIPQNVVLGTYALMGISYAIFFRRTLKRENLMFYAGFGLLACSVALDVLPIALPAHVLFEEGCKVLGVAGCLAFFTTQGLVLIREMIPATSAAKPKLKLATAPARLVLKKQAA